MTIVSGSTVSHSIQWDAVSIDLLNSDDSFLGIGDIKINGIPMRSAARPMFVELRNPFGVELLNWRIIDHVTRANGEHELTLAGDQRSGGNMEFLLHTVRPRINTTDWSNNPTPAQKTRLRLRLWPVTRTINGRDFTGFGYQYLYHSDDIPQYKLLDRSTWEIESDAVDNQIWLRGAEPTIFSVKSSTDFYSSEWYLPGIANPNIFQFKPLQTHLQGFTFTAHRQGILVTWATEVRHIRTLLQKDRNSSAIVHLHEHCDDLGHTLNTSPVEVLFWNQPDTDRIERANCYGDVKELVHQSLHDQIGMHRDRVTVTGMIEEWSIPDMKAYTTRGLPKLLDFGAKTIELANHFQNNMNVYGLSNMCCTIDLKVADSVGEDNLRQFCTDAIAGGASTRMWANTSLSTVSRHFMGNDVPHGRLSTELNLLPEPNSPVLKTFASRHAWVRDPSGSIESDHYRPRFAVMNLRDPGVRKYWMDSWKYAHDQVGISGFFLDSSFNLSSDKFHWYQDEHALNAGGATADQAHLLVHQRPAHAPTASIQSLYRAHLDMVIEMQKMGYSYCGEDQGVFGVHRCGWNLPANLNQLFLWSDCLQVFDFPVLEKAGVEPDDIFFRALAYRAMWLVFWNPQNDCLSFHPYQVRGDYDRPAQHHLDWLRSYNSVDALMHNRRILPDESGVIYEHNGKQVLWSFKPLTLDLATAAYSVTDAVTGTTTPATGKLSVPARSILLISKQPTTANVDIQITVSTPTQKVIP